MDREEAEVPVARARRGDGRRVALAAATNDSIAW